MFLLVSPGVGVAAGVPDEDGVVWLLSLDLLPQPAISPLPSAASAMSAARIVSGRAAEARTASGRFMRRTIALRPTPLQHHGPWRHDGRGALGTRIPGAELALVHQLKRQPKRVGSRFGSFRCSSCLFPREQGVTGMNPSALPASLTGRY